MIEVQGDILQKFFWLSGLTMSELAKQVDSSRGSLEYYVKNSRINKEVLENIENYIGIKYTDFCFFIQNAQSKEQKVISNSSHSTYWRDKYNEALDENSKMFKENQELKVRIGEQRKLIDFLENQAKNRDIKKGP